MHCQLSENKLSQVSHKLYKIPGEICGLINIYYYVITIPLALACEHVKAGTTYLFDLGRTAGHAYAMLHRPPGPTHDPHAGTGPIRKTTINLSL